MIKDISTQSPRWMSVYSGSHSPYISPGSMSAGMMRYNSNTQTIEVYDGNTWLALAGSADVSLSPEAQQVMDWAYKKMIGGYVVSFRCYDRKTDRSNDRHYIITDEQEFEKELGKIITLESMKQSG